MSAKLDGIRSNSIIWEKEQSEISEDSKGKCTITASGSVANEDDDISLEQAILLIPYFIPITNNGPIGSSIRYSGAILTDRSAKYNGDGTIEVSATYQIAVPENQVSAPAKDKDGNQVAVETKSDSDKASRTAATEDAPILTHPIVSAFSATSRRNLASLLAGEIRVNPKYKDAEDGGTDRELWEFIRDTEDGTDIELVTFDPFEVSARDRATSVTSSPLEYARLIASGVEVWKRPVIRHNIVYSSNKPVADEDFNNVGTALAYTPWLAPTPTNDRQWFLLSITDSTDNGTTWTVQKEYELSGEGGVLKALYPNGAAVIE